MNKKGFTIIELLVAIAVFSIVSAVVYSAFKNEIQAYVNQKKFSSVIRQFRAVSHFLSMDFKTVDFDPVDSSEVTIEVAKKDYFSFIKINEDFTKPEDLKRIAFYKHEDQIFRLTQNLDSDNVVAIPDTVDLLISSAPGGVTETLAKKILNFELKYLDSDSNEINQSSLDTGNKNSLTEISSVEISLESEIDYWGKKPKKENYKFLVQCRNIGI
jgi:prepilin-type N-terminal cleavage/methylation domain-containing protein